MSGARTISVLLGLLLSSGEAWAERKALLIGNADYAARNADLNNPLRDIKRLKTVLEKAGFSAKVAKNVNEPRFRATLNSFANRLSPGDEVFVYYSGHGIAIDGQNFLLGVDFNASNKTDALARNSDIYAVNRLVSRLEESNARLRIIVIDACRDEPFTKRKGWRRRGVTESTYRGFAPVASTRMGQGTLVAFAAEGKQQAFDRIPSRDLNLGPYAYTLSKLILKPGLDIQLLFSDVRTEVQRLTDYQQSPEYNSKLGGRFYFIPPSDGGSSHITMENSTNYDDMLAQAKAAQREAQREIEAAEEKARKAEKKAREEHEARRRAHRARVEKAWTSVNTFATTTALPRKKRIAALNQFLSDFPEDNPHIEAAQKYKRLLRAGKEPKPILSPKNGMSLIPAGTFMMGCQRGDSHCEDDEKPAHRVRLDAYYIDQTEVTVAAYRKCVQAKKCKAPKKNDHSNYDKRGRDNHPVNYVNWHNAKAYCAFVSKRLPTEAEWENAARAQDGDVYPWGDSSPNDKRARFGKGWDGGTVPVRSYAAGAHGLYDMAGNLWEWVEDCYEDKAYKRSDNTDKLITSPVNGQDVCPSGRRVLRGGSFDDWARDLRASFRNWDDPGFRYGIIGFRCVAPAS